LAGRKVREVVAVFEDGAELQSGRPVAPVTHFVYG
jgi:hypothetical protein